MVLRTFESQDMATEETPIGRGYDECVFNFQRYWFESSMYGKLYTNCRIAQ